MSVNASNTSSSRHLVNGAVAVFLVAALHLGAGMWPDVIWGGHHLSFFPLGVQVAFYAAVGLLVLAPFNRQLRRLVGACLQYLGNRPVWTHYLMVGISGLALFTAFPVQHHLFGDSLMRISELESPGVLGKGRYQYDGLVRYHLHQFFKSQWGWQPIRSYTAISTAYGVLFLLGSLALARQLGRGLAERATLFGGLASAGFVLLFFGYGEVYNSVVAVTIIALLALMLYTEGKCRLWLPCLALAATGALHILGLFILPALVYAAILRHDLDRRLPDAWRRWLVVMWIAASAVLGGLLFQIVRPTSAVPVFTRSPHLPYMVFSPTHLLDMANEHLLVALPGWIGLVLAFGMGKKRGGDRRFDVLCVAAWVSALMWGLVNPALGSLDWDLLSMLGPPWVAMGLFFLILKSREGGNLEYYGVILLGLSLFHTLPWIALQRHVPQAVQAIEAMVERDPHILKHSGRGGKLAVRLLQEGFDEAGRRQLEKAVGLGRETDELALRTLCQLYMEEARFDEAASLLKRVLYSVPDRVALNTLRYFRQHAPGGRRQSEAILEEVMDSFPHPTYFGVLGEFYREEAREEDLVRLTRYLDRTIGNVERQLERGAASGEMLLRLGALYLRRGQVSEAREVLTRARAMLLRKDLQAAAVELMEVIDKVEEGNE